jgi:ubiquinone/menaquinone biosynthesis C-methylase UbiE
MKFDNSPLLRRVVQVALDLSQKPIADSRILDLACAHGMFSLEFAMQGAQVLGIEGRQSWLETAARGKADTSLSNVEFVKDDVRNLSKEKYGEFDIVLCLGILYHLDAPDVFEFLQRVANVCRNFAIIETHFSLEAEAEREWRGHRYWGRPTEEHPEDATENEKLKATWASLDNQRSFWLTQASLCNLLRHVGFTSVFDCRNPIGNMYVDDKFQIWEDRITLAAVKGLPVHLGMSPERTAESEADWPEQLAEHYFQPEADFITQLVENEE